MLAATKKSWFIAIGLALLAVFLYQKRATLWQIATVTAFSGAFTLLLAPVCSWLERKGCSSATAAILSIALLFLTIVILLSAFIPYLVAHSIDLFRSVTPTITKLFSYIENILVQYGVQIEQKDKVINLLTSSATAITTRVARGSMAFAQQAGLIGFSLVIAYYLLRERRIVANHLILCLPIHWRTSFLCALLGCKNAVLGYLSGVLKTSLFVGGATLLGLLLLGVRDAFLLALFMGFFEVLPYIGPVLGAIPILLVTLPEGMYRALLSLGLVIIVQQIEGNFVSPYFTASSTSIHPLTALISVFILGSLMGLWGIVLAIPLVVTLRSVYWSIRQMTALMNR